MERKSNAPKRGSRSRVSSDRGRSGASRRTSRPRSSGERAKTGRSSRTASNTERGARTKRRAFSSSRPGSTRSKGARTPHKRERRGGRERKEAPLILNGENGKKDDVIPALQKDTIRVIPLGGVEEIGRNMTVFEYGDDIIVVDCGFQFQEDTTPGIDFILPNTKYLEDRKEKIRAIVVTHGHLDHIGAFPYVMERIGMPPIYSRRLTTVMIKKRQEEFPHMPKFDIREVEKNEKIKLGNLTVRFFAVTHTIPDSMGIIIETPHGAIVHTGDLKVDHVDGVPTKAEEKEFKVFEKEDVLMLCADSTNVERPGFSFPERDVHKNIEEFIKTVPGRLVIGTFASQLERIAKIVEIAERHKKKIVIEGRSMKTNIDIVRELEILKVKKETIVPVEHIADYPDNKIIVLATGAQGDEFSALMRIATKSHRHFKIKKDDTVLLSSSIIPGNERAVQKLKDNLSRQGAHIIHYQIAGVHSSGHANREETLWIHKKIKPKFFMPLHGYHYMLRIHKDIAVEAGLKSENGIVPDNSSILEIRDGGKKYHGKDF